MVSAIKKAFFATLFTLVCTLVVIDAESKIYKWIDPSGRVLFTDRYHPGAEELHIDSGAPIEIKPQKNQPVSDLFDSASTHRMLSVRSRFLEEIAIVESGLQNNQKAYDLAKREGRSTDELLSKINAQKLYLESLREKMHTYLQAMLKNPKKVVPKGLLLPRRENAT